MAGRSSTMPVCSKCDHVTCRYRHRAVRSQLRESKEQEIACDTRYLHTTTMDLQLDTEIRNVLELVRSSMRTNGTPLEAAIRELRRVIESVQNAKDSHHPKWLLDEKIGKDASEEKDQFRLEDMMSRL
ncbi:Siderophore triacetylfusarinine C esterase [Fusarium oxysporum f. sp. albedinis]|nr:Siderophore triacetylfusarinine C esterase [Fusarium oxysporum f. sp. albedinis]